MSKVIDEYTQLMKLNGEVLLERRIEMLIKPHPRFIPEQLWLKLASKFLYVREQYK